MMYPTWRGVLILLLVAPFIALATWVPVVGWLALGLLLLVLGVLVVDFRAAGGISRFQISREHDTKLSLGADNPIRLKIHSLRRRPTIFWVRDEPPADFRVASSMLDGTIEARSSWEGVYYVHPLQRGDYTFADINLRWQGPLGLMVRQARVEASAPVKVYPNLLDVRRYDLLLRQNRLQEMGLRSTRVFGQGNEFERLREYLPDDDFRRINWKATARRNRPVTVEYQTERSQIIMCLIDIGRMMQSPVADIAKLDYVINAVLLLGYVATGMGDKIGMMTFADDIGHYLGPRHGRGQFYRMLELLYAVSAQPVEPNYRRAIAYFALKQRRRALTVIFTDLSGGLGMQEMVHHVALLAKSSLPLVVTISDPDVHQAAQLIPSDSLAAYQRSAASQLLDERRLAVDTLRRHGVLTLDVPAHQLSWSMINRYLELKGRGLI
ncbi:MAG: DUF58 domain-containing protein [Anaerolineae bacterium]|nr:DUF58 domain-containing protein [Anaerolineae bacterium]